MALRAAPSARPALLPCLLLLYTALASLPASTRAITVAWNHSEPAWVQLHTVADAHAFVSEGNWTFLGFFPSLNDIGLRHFSHVAHSELHGTHISFAWANDTDIGREYGVEPSQWPTVLLMQAEEATKGEDAFVEKRVAMHPARTNITVESLGQMWQQYIQPLPPVSELGVATIHQFHRRGLPIVFCFLNYADKLHASYVELLSHLGIAFKNALTFGYLDGHKFDREMLAYGLPQKHMPACSLATFKPQRRNYPFSYKQKFTFNNLHAHFEKFLNGQLEPTHRSGPVPYQSGPVRHVTYGSWFDEVLTDRKVRDVLVMFFAPWCEHSKKLAPYWTALAELLQPDADKVSVVDIDGTKNDIFDLPGNPGNYPRVYLFPYQKRDHPVLYVASEVQSPDGLAAPENAGPSVQSLVNFLLQHSAVLDPFRKESIQARLEEQIYAQEQREFEKLIRANETNTEAMVQELLAQFKVQQKEQNRAAKEAARLDQLQAAGKAGAPKQELVDDDDEEANAVEAAAAAALTNAATTAAVDDRVRDEL